jgi:archaellin
MHRIGVASVLGLLVLSLVLVACGGAGYIQTGAATTSHQGTGGGDVTVEISKANGTAEQDIEDAGDPEVELEVDVTLAVGKGSYKIELLGKDDQVTLTLEARDGETVSGHGQMVTDSFGEASYRVTAVDAENVDYVLEYTFQ